MYICTGICSHELIKQLALSLNILKHAINIHVLYNVLLVSNNALNKKGDKQCVDRDKAQSVCDLISC